MDDEVQFPEISPQSLQSGLIKWWSKNGRSFPWRETHNEFHILISEVLLQRTRANQVVAVYLALVSKYPSPTEMGATGDELLSQILYSLGLPQRVNTILQMVRQINQEFDGKVPSTYSELRTLEGVGDYIASAVCCFGFNQPMILVDTNTVRIIGRLFGLPQMPNQGVRNTSGSCMSYLLDEQNPRGI